MSARRSAAIGALLLGFAEPEAEPEPEQAVETPWGMFEEAQT